MRDAYIVQSIRTPGCKKSKGAFKDTRPEDLLSFILKSAIEKTSNLEMKDVDDIMIGCAFPEAEQGLNIGRVASQIAGFPAQVSGATVQPVLCFRPRGHRPGILARHVGLVGYRHWRGIGIHDLCSYGWKSSQAPS